MSNLTDFLNLPYAQLEEINLAAKKQRHDRVDINTIREERLKFLTDAKGIKAVVVMFSDLEGRLHMLDYDKKFLLKSWDNLTFDGSSIRGFTAQKESDLRLFLDWSAFYVPPADVFGAGKVLVFGEVDMKMAERVTAQLLAYAESEGDIRVIVNSPGGHVESGDTIHDMIRFVGNRVKVIGTGWVASAGAHIFLGARRENRFCLPFTRFLLHQPLGGVRGQASDITIEAEEIIKMRERLIREIAAETGQPYDKVVKIGRAHV